MTENPSTEPLADGAVNTPADGGVTVESPALTLAELNKSLGADFKDTSTALKALKDTKDFVGKRKEDIAAEVKAGLQQSAPDMSKIESDVQSLKNELFYSQNPQYKDLAPLITKLGGDPAEVVGSEEFKAVYGKVAKADEIAQSQSVVNSNNRISSPPDVLTGAVEIANSRGTGTSDVATFLAQHINSAGRGE